jgi:hypothetical protein
MTIFEMNNGSVKYQDLFKWTIGIVRVPRLRASPGHGGAKRIIAEYFRFVKNLVSE